MTIDGADEVAPDLSLIKGGGGALLREKIVARASARMIVIADESKWVADAWKISAADRDRPVWPACHASAPSRPRTDGNPGALTLRQGKNGHPFVTDGGHFILDAALGRIAEPRSLAGRLADIPGVVEHGLFIGLAQAVVLAGPGGIRVVERP